MSQPAAWQPDPTGKHDHRWWDGERWTEHVADAGQASVDPLDSAPPPPSAGSAPPPGGDAGASDVAGASPGGWAQGATDQGRDPDAGGGLAGGGNAGDASGGGGLSGGQPGGTWQQPGAQGWQGSEQPGQQGWQGGQQPGQQGWQGGQQPGQQGWQGGPAPAWEQPGGGGNWQQGGGASRGNDGVALSAMIVGILAILVSWIPVLGAIGGIVALVLGLVGRSRIKKSGASGNGMAVTGIATGAVAIVINVAILSFFVVAGGDFFEQFGSYVECVEETGDEELCQQQLEDGLFERFGQ